MVCACVVCVLNVESSIITTHTHTTRHDGNVWCNTLFQISSSYCPSCCPYCTVHTSTVLSIPGTVVLFRTSVDA